MEVYFKDLTNPEELIEKRKELKKGECLTLILDKNSFQIFEDEFQFIEY